MKKIYIIAIGIIVGATSAYGTWYFLDSHHSRQENVTHKTSIKNQADIKLENMSLREKVASLFVFHVSGTDESNIKAFVDTYNPAGMILMGDNISGDDASLRRITTAIRGTDDPNYPRLVAIDEEGGTVKRLSSDTFLDAKTLKNLDKSKTQDAFLKRSELLRSLGITLNFGIIADVTDDKNSFIYDRVLGTTPITSSNNVQAAVAGTRGLTLSTLKHFPGHGETPADSHNSIPTSNIGYSAWLQKDALPFKAGIKEGADLVMFGHLRYSSIDSAPASLSKKWHDILRNELSFQGVMISDDMCMLQMSGDSNYSDPVVNAVSALQAGNTLLLYVLDNRGSFPSRIDPNSLIDGVVEAVTSDKIDISTIDDNLRRIHRLQADTLSFEKNK